MFLRRWFTTFTHTHTHTQPFDGPLSGTTRVDRYQKKHSHTRTHPDHQTSFINFLHLVHSTCHHIFFPYRPGITSMQHAASHTTTVQPSAHNQWYILIGKQWYQLPELIPARSYVCAVVLVYVMCSYISRTSIHTLQRSSLVHTDAVSIHCFVLCVVFFSTKATQKWSYIWNNKERKCADTIKYTEEIFSSSTRKLLWFEISKMLIAV